VRFLVAGKRYMTVAEYNTSVAKPRILAVQLGLLLVRQMEAVSVRFLQLKNFLY
jgi:hypothetical protein